MDVRQEDGQPVRKTAAGAQSPRASADYWIIMDTNVMYDYAVQADGSALRRPRRQLPEQFVKFIGDNLERVATLDTIKREVRATLRRYNANDHAHVERLLGGFKTVPRRDLRGFRAYKSKIDAMLDSAAADPESELGAEWIDSKRTALSKNGFEGVAGGSADAERRACALKCLRAAAACKDAWIMAKSAKLSERKPVRLVSNDGDIVTFAGGLKDMTCGRLLVARPLKWGQ